VLPSAAYLLRFAASLIAVRRVAGCRSQRRWSAVRNAADLPFATPL